MQQSEMKKSSIVIGIKPGILPILYAKKAGNMSSWSLGSSSTIPVKMDSAMKNGMLFIKASSAAESFGGSLA